MTTRTMTYAPESTNRGNRPVPQVSHPAWILCRRLRELRIADDIALYRLAEQGHIRPDDLLVNESAERCVVAKDVPELRRIFRANALRRFERFSPALARAIAALWRSNETPSQLRRS